MKKYKLYLFDFDGTLFDSTESLIDAYQAVLDKYHKKANNKDEFRLYLGMSLPRFMEYKGIDIKYTQELIDIFHKHAQGIEVVKKTILYPDSKEAIEYILNNNLLFGIVTGGHSLRIKEVFDYYHLHFDKLACCVTNELYKIPKPNPDPINIALKLSGFTNRKNEVVYIGDALQDELSAKAAGIDYLQVKRSTNDFKGDINSLMDLFKK